MKEELIRPSALPKLAECRCFEGKEEAGEAAARGTRVDAAIRFVWAKGHELPGWEEMECPKVGDEDELMAIDWAVEKLEELSMQGEVACHVEVREGELRAASVIPGVKDGTMDALCVEGGWLADFKTGQVRNYREQMAAYALACMDTYFADRWTAFLLFVDQQVVVRHDFTLEEASAIVEGVVNAPPECRACEYCSWCKKFEDCPAVVGAVQSMPAGEVELPGLMERLVQDHKEAWEFLSRYAVVEKWVRELRARLCQTLTPPEGVEKVEDPYFSRVVVSGQKKVMPLALGRYITELGWQRVLRICPLLPVKEVEAVWREVMDKPLPEEMFTTVGGSVQLRLKKIKNK